MRIGVAGGYYGDVSDGVLMTSRGGHRYGGGRGHAELLLQGLHQLGQVVGLGQAQAHVSLLVAIGHPLFDSPDVLGALQDYVQQVKSNYKSRN